MTFYEKHFLPNTEWKDSKFSVVDTKELFLKNLKTQPSNWHYRTKDVNYSYNSYGYRTQEFEIINWEQSIVIFGCSQVEGIGVSEDETINHYLSNIMNCPVINMGQSATSIWYSFYNSVILSKFYPAPRAVVHLWTDPARYTIKERDNIASINHCMPLNDRKSPFYMQWLKQAQNIEFHTNFITLAAECLWIGKSQYAAFTTFSALSDQFKCIETIDYARDLMHNGPQTNKLIAEEIAKELMPTSSINKIHE